MHPGSHVHMHALISAPGPATWCLTTTARLGLDFMAYSGLIGSITQTPRFWQSWNNISAEIFDWFPAWQMVEHVGYTYMLLSWRVYRNIRAYQYSDCLCVWTVSSAVMAGGLYVSSPGSWVNWCWNKQVVQLGKSSVHKWTVARCM